MSVGYSRRTSTIPSASTWGEAASSSCRCASTPSLVSPGSGPSGCVTSLSTSSRVITSRSPAGFTISHTPGASRSVFGAFIQLRGL